MFHVSSSFHDIDLGFALFLLFLYVIHAGKHKQSLEKEEEKKDKMCTLTFLVKRKERRLWNYDIMEIAKKQQKLNGKIY